MVYFTSHSRWQHIYNAPAVGAISYGILLWGRIATHWLLISVAIARMTMANLFSPLVGMIKAIAIIIIDINEIEKLMILFILF